MKLTKEIAEIITSDDRLFDPRIWKDPKTGKT